MWFMQVEFILSLVTPNTDTPINFTVLPLNDNKIGSANQNFVSSVEQVEHSKSSEKSSDNQGV